PMRDVTDSVQHRIHDDVAALLRSSSDDEQERKKSAWQRSTLRDQTLFTRSIAPLTFASAGKKQLPIIDRNLGSMCVGKYPTDILHVVFYAGSARQLFL